MKTKNKKNDLKKIEVYEHLEHTLKHTTYADRLRWLEEANEFVWKVRKKYPKGIPG